MESEDRDVQRYLERLPKAAAMVAATDTRLRSTDSPIGIPFEILLDSLSFARKTIQAVGGLIREDRMTQARILTRSFFEVATRFLWASHQSDGWKRLAVDSAHEDREWAKKAKASGISNFASLARTVLMSAVRKRWSKAGKCLPSMREMLRMIDKAQGSEKNADLGEYSYFAVYAPFSKATHGDLSLLDEHVSTKNAVHVTTAVVQSTMMLLQAAHRWAGWDTNSLLKEVVGILRPGEVVVS